MTQGQVSDFLFHQNQSLLSTYHQEVKNIYGKMHTLKANSIDGQLIFLHHITILIRPFVLFHMKLCFLIIFFVFFGQAAEEALRSLQVTSQARGPPKRMNSPRYTFEPPLFFLAYLYKINIEKLSI